MQILNWLKLQPLLADVDPLFVQVEGDRRIMRDTLVFAIQAFCAAGPRKVTSRTDIFQGVDSFFRRHLLHTLICFGKGNRRDFIK